MRRGRLLLGLVLGSFLIAPRALAGGASPEDAALADSLYAEGGKLMEAGRWTEGCAKIEASLKLDPGIGSSLRLAYCWEHLGKTASASAMYRETEAMALRAGDKRAGEAAKHAKELEPLLSRIALDVAPENRSGGVEIRRDGKVIDPAAWTSGIPVDPGIHVLEAAAPGRLPWKMTLTIEAKPGATTVRVPALQDAPVSTEGDAAPKVPPFWSAPRIAGATVGGAGGVGLALGAVFGGLAMSKKSASNAAGHCDAKDFCDPAGLTLRADGVRWGNLSTGLFIGGGALAAGGLVVFLASPSAALKSSAAAPPLGIALGPADVRITGTW